MVEQRNERSLEKLEGKQPNKHEERAVSAKWVREGNKRGDRRRGASERASNELNGAHTSTNAKW